MSLDIEQALSDGFDRLLTQPGAYLVGAFLALGFANTVVVQSLMDVVFEFVLEEYGPQMAETGSLDQFQNEVGVLPFAVSLPPTLLAVAFVALAFVGEALGIVGVRVFAASDPNRLPDGLTDDLPLATVNGFLAGIFVFVIVTIGFVVGLIGLIIGGFVLATFLAVSLVFVRQAVALEDENAISALSESWSVTKGNRWYLFGLLIILGVIGGVIGFVSGLLGGYLGPTVNALVSVVVGAVVGVFGIGVTTRAYQQLRTGQATPAGVEEEYEEPGSQNDVY
mgnify:FL=1